MSQQLFTEALVGASTPAALSSRRKGGGGEAGTGLNFSNVLRGFMQGTPENVETSSPSSSGSVGNRPNLSVNERPFAIPAISTSRIASRKAGLLASAARSAPPPRVAVESKASSPRPEKVQDTSDTPRNESLPRKAERLLDRLQQHVREVKEELQSLPEKDRPPLLEVLRKSEGGSGFWSSLPDETATAALEAGFGDPDSAIGQALEEALKLAQSLPEADLQSLLAAISTHQDVSSILDSISESQPVLEQLIKCVGQDQGSSRQNGVLQKETADSPIHPEAGKPEKSQADAAATEAGTSFPTPENVASVESSAAAQSQAEKVGNQDSEESPQQTSSISSADEAVTTPESSSQQTTVTESGSRREQTGEETSPKLEGAVDAECPQNASPQSTSPTATQKQAEALVSIATTEESADQSLLEKVSSKGSKPQVDKGSHTEGLPRVQTESGGQGTNQQGGSGFGQSATPNGPTGPANQNASAATSEQVKGSLFSQLVEKASLLKGPQQEKVLTMQLKPEFLGKVDLFLTSRDGAVTARILTDNPAVRDQLEAIAPQIRDHLAEQGIQLQQLTVDISSRQPDDHNRQGRFSQNSGKRSRLGRIGESTDGDPAALSESASKAELSDGKTIDITI